MGTSSSASQCRPFRTNARMVSLSPKPFILFLIASLAVGCGTSWLNKSKPSASTAATSNASLTTPSRIVAEGRIEPANGVVGVYARAGDRLIRYSNQVREGAVIKSGDELGEMLSHRARKGEIAAISAKLAEANAVREAETAARKADVAAAERTIEQVADTDDQLSVKKQQIALLKNAYDAAKLECEKIARLRKRSDLVSESTFNQTKLSVQKAKTAWKAAEIELSSLEGNAKSQLAVAKAKRDSIAASHDRALATIPLASLKQQQSLLEDQAKESRLPAPIDGTIVRVNTRPGESITNEPLLLIADLDKVVCVTEVYESYLTDLEIGQKATLRSTTFGDNNPLHGRITSIGRIIMTPDLKPLDPFAKSDVRVVEVRIEIDSGNDTEIAARLVNLQVDVEIDTE